MHQPPHILVVDDEVPILRLVSSILTRAGFDVATANCGREGLLAVERQPAWIDLLLTDVVMSDLEGPALAENCKLVRPDLPVLFMTGYADRAAFPTILKPFKAEALVARVWAELQ